MPLSGACSYPSCSQEDLAMRYDWTLLWRSTIGFDRLFDVLDEVQRTAEESYPPTTSNASTRTASRSRLHSPASRRTRSTLTFEHNVLTLEGRKNEKEEKTFLHGGSSARSFHLIKGLGIFWEAKASRCGCGPSRGLRLREWDMADNKPTGT